MSTDPTSPIWVPPRRNLSKDACFFYHTADLSDGSTAYEQWDLRGCYADHIGHVDLRRARVLDVGTALNFLSFSAEEAGAREAVSFDLDTAAHQHLLPFHRSLYVTDHAAWTQIQTRAFESRKNAHWFTHQDRESQARAVYGYVYDLPRAIGQFDVVILGAILEQLGDPIRAIGAIAKVAARRIVINTDLIAGHEPIAQFKDDPEHPDCTYIFWYYTVENYRNVLEIYIFTINHIEEREFSTLSVDAASTAGRGDPGPPLSPVGCEAIAGTVIAED